MEAMESYIREQGCEREPDYPFNVFRLGDTIFEWVPGLGAVVLEVLDAEELQAVEQRKIIKFPSRESGEMRKTA